MLEIKNAMVVAVVFIFLKYNGLCERLADSNLYTQTYTNYTKEKILCRNFHTGNTVCMHFTCEVIILVVIQKNYCICLHHSFANVL